ncbi:microtubule-associated protein futsch-like isoform X2 [Ischnura elegans]|uniref:microtubule-associated protein futsch-like isoform X2 n=1 Tax=Ischnura elegans TaxID=197161 RepID=UPI001ED86BBA|nr:microtubule-associated protein futsch-like isoform X2 [Ischnura elegans]
MALYGHIIVIRKTGEDGSCFPLLSRACRIGKGRVCDIRIQREPVMKEHCLIEVSSDSQVKIRNLNKKCHTLVNSTPLSTDWRDLKHMDTIVIADRSFRWEYLEGSIFHSANEESAKTIASKEQGNVSDNKSGSAIRRSLVPVQNVDTGSSNDVSDLICFDSPLVVSDSKRQSRKSRSSMLNGNNLVTLTNEMPKVKTPKRRASLKHKESGASKFISSPISLVSGREIPQSKSHHQLIVAQSCEISEQDKSFAAQENRNITLGSSIDKEGKENEAEEVESGSTLKPRNGRRSSMRKSTAHAVNTSISQIQKSESSVVTTYFGNDRMMNENVSSTLNGTGNLLSETIVIEDDTPRTLRKTKNSVTLIESADLLKGSPKSGLHTFSEGSSFSAVTCTPEKSSRSKKSDELKANMNSSVSISDNQSCKKSTRNSVKIVVIPPTPEPMVKFTVRKKWSINENLSVGSGRKSVLSEKPTDSPSMICKGKAVPGSEDECERSGKKLELPSREEEKSDLKGNERKSLVRDPKEDIVPLLRDGSFSTIEAKKNTPCSRRMSSVSEYSQMNVSATQKYSSEQDLSVASINLVNDARGGQWSVTEAVRTSPRKSLRKRSSQSLRSPATPHSKDLASVFKSNDTNSSDINETPIPSDDEYASWLSQRTSVASTSEANPSPLISKGNLRQSTSESHAQSYLENVQEAMKSPLSIIVNSPSPSLSRSRSIGGVNQTEDKTLSPAIRKSKRKCIATPYFVASIYNRLKTPTADASKSFEVSAMGGKSKDYVTLRKKVNSPQKINSSDVDYLSDLSSNCSYMEEGGNDSLMQTSSLILDDCDVTDAEVHPVNESPVKSSWTSTPAVSNSTRKKRVTFGSSLCSVDLDQVPVTPLKPELVFSNEVVTTPGKSFSENSTANATVNTRDSLKRKKKSIKTPSKQSLAGSTPKIYDAAPNNTESFVESSYNSALDDTITIMNTPSLLDKGRSIESVGSLQSVESTMGETPVSDQNHSKIFSKDEHGTPKTLVNLSEIKAKFQRSLAREDSENDLSRTNPSPAKLGNKLVGQSAQKSDDDGTAPYMDSALSTSSLSAESVIDVNGQEWTVTKDVSSRRESLRSRKSCSTYSAIEYSSIIQDMTKTPIPSDGECASWLSVKSLRNSVASINGAKSTSILQKSRRKSNADSSASTSVINEDMAVKSHLSTTPNTPSSVQLRSKIIDNASTAKDKASTPIKRSKRKSTQSLGTPCFVASIYNRLKTPTAVGSNSFEVSDLGGNTKDYVTVRQKINRMSGTQEMNSSDVDNFSDLSSNNSCLEDGGMDSLMHTSSLMSNKSDVSGARGNLVEESHRKISWTSTPAVSNSTRKRRGTLGASLCNEDLGQMPSTPQNPEMVHSKDITPAAKSFSEEGTASERRNTRQSLMSQASIPLSMKTAASPLDSSAFNLMLDETSSPISNINESQLSTSKISTRSVRSCKSFMNDESNTAADIGKIKNKRVSDARSSPSLVSTSWIFSKEPEKRSESSVCTVVSEVKTPAGTGAHDESNSQCAEVDTSIETAKKEEKRRSTRKSILKLGTPDYSESLSDLYKTPLSLAQKVPEEQDESIMSHKSLGRKSSVGSSSFKGTPLTRKVTRKSVVETPDYSESMKDLLKTPGLKTMKIEEVEITEGVINEEHLPSPAHSMDFSHVESKTPLISSELEEISSASSARRSLRLNETSLSHVPVCQQVENMTTASSSVEANSSIDSESGTFASAENEEIGLDSQEQGMSTDSTMESGNMPIAVNEFSSGSRITFQRKKLSGVNAVADSSCSVNVSLDTTANTETIDDEKSASFIQEGPVKMRMADSVSQRSTTATEVEIMNHSSSKSRKSLRIGDISTPDAFTQSNAWDSIDLGSGVNASASLVSESGSFTSALNMEDALNAEENDAAVNFPMTTGRRKSIRRKSSISSLFKVTPVMKKEAKKSIGATPDYSDSMKDLLKTPAVSALIIPEENSPIDIKSDESEIVTPRRNSSHASKRSSVVTESPLAINPSANVDSLVDSEKVEALNTTVEAGKERSSLRKSSIASSLKVTPLIGKVLRRSAVATPDFSESMKDLLKTPAVTALPTAEEDLHTEVSVEESEIEGRNLLPFTRRSSMFIEEETFATPLATNQSVNTDRELDSVEGVTLDNAVESGKTRSSSRKSIASSFKVTPVVRKVARKSVATTPDYSESMKDLLKTPAITAMPTTEENMPTEFVNEDSDMDKSSCSTKMSSMFKEEETSSTPVAEEQAVYVDREMDYEEGVTSDNTVESGKRRSSSRKLSIASSVTVTPAIRKVAMSVASTPDYSESMKDLLKTPAVTVLPTMEEDYHTEVPNEESQMKEINLPSSRRSSKFIEEETPATPVVVDIEKGIALDNTVESGKRRSSSRKSVASSPKVTTHIRKGMRNSVTDTPDYSESMKDLMKTPALPHVVAAKDFLGEVESEHPLHSKTKRESLPSEKRLSMLSEEASPIAMGNETNPSSERDCEQNVTLNTTFESGNTRSSTRKLSSGSSFKVTPILRKVTRKSMAATPDYSGSMRDMLRTPAITTDPMTEEIILTEKTTLESQSKKCVSDDVASRSSMLKEEIEVKFPQTMANSMNVDNVQQSEEDVDFDSALELGKRKSSVGSSLGVTPLGRRVTRKSVNSTPDFAQAMKDLLKTPAVTSIPFSEDISREITLDESNESVQERDSLYSPTRSSMLIEGEVAKSPVAMSNSKNVGIEMDSMGVVTLDTATEVGTRKSSRRKSSVSSSLQVTPLIEKIAKIKVSATPDYSESMKDLMKTPAAATIPIPEEDLPAVIVGEESQLHTLRRTSVASANRTSMFIEEEAMATPLAINQSINAESEHDSEPGEVLNATLESRKRRSSTRKSSIASSFKVTPMVRKVARKIIAATPDYSESMKDLLKTPAVSTVIVPEEDLAEDVSGKESQLQTLRRTSMTSENRSSMFVEEEPMSTSMAINQSVNVESEQDSEPGEVLDASLESRKRRSSTRKSSIASSFKVTPMTRKVARKSIAATPDYSESMKDLLKTPAVTTVIIPEEDLPEDISGKESQLQTLRRTSMTFENRSSMFVEEEPMSTSKAINQSVNVESEQDSEPVEVLDSILESRKRKSSARKSSIASSFKVTPMTRKVARKSIAATPDYSESMKDLLKTPAVNALPVSEELPTEVINECETPITIHQSEDGEDIKDSEECVALDTNVESGKRRSSSRKSSNSMSVTVTPLLRQVVRKSVNATPDYSESIKDLLRTPAITILPEGKNTAMDVISEESPSTTRDSMEKESIFNEIQLLCSKSATVNVISVEPSEVGMQNSPSVDEERDDQNLPCHTMNSSAVERKSLSSKKNPKVEATGTVPREVNLESGLSHSGRRKSASRASSEGHENIKWIKKWLGPRSPTSRYSDIRGVKELFAQPSPQSSYVDVSGLQELFASPMVHHTEGEGTEKRGGEAESLSIDSDSYLKGKISSPYRNPVVVVSKLKHVPSALSKEENEPVLPAKSLRNGRSKKVAPKNLRLTRKMNDVEVDDSNLDLPESEDSVSHHGKENKLKTKQSDRKKEATSDVVMKDLPIVNESSSLPDVVVDSMILKSNLRNIAGQRGLRKHVHFDAQASETIEKKVELDDEDGASVKGKSSKRKSVRGNTTGAVSMAHENLSGNERNSQKLQDEGEDESVSKPQRRGNLRKKGMTEIPETAVEDGESSKKTSVSAAEKQPSAVERSTRRKKADLADVTVGVTESKKSLKTSVNNENVSEAADDKSEKHLPKKTITTESQGENSDEPSQQLTRRGKKSAKLDEAAGAMDVDEGKMGDKPKRGSQKKEELARDVGDQVAVESAPISGRQMRRTRGIQGVDQTVDNTNVSQIDGRSKSSAKKKAEKVKDDEEKVVVESEPTLGRRTRRMREMEGNNDTITKNIKPTRKTSKTEKEISENIHSEEETACREASAPKSKGKIGKGASVKLDKQMSEDKESQMLEKESKGSVTESAKQEVKEDHSVEKNAINRTGKTRRQATKKDDDKSEKEEVISQGIKEGNVELNTVAPTERRTRRGKVATTLVGDITQDVNESQNNKERNLTRSTKRVRENVSNEEVTMEKRSRRTKNSVEKGDGAESVRSEMKAAVVEPQDEIEVIPKLNTRRTKVTRSSGESSVKDAPSSSNKVQVGKRISQEQIMCAIEEEKLTERPTRQRKNVSRKNEGKDSILQAPEAPVEEGQDNSKLKKGVSVARKDEEKEVLRGRNLRNAKNTTSDTPEEKETKGRGRKRTESSSVSVADEKSQPSQKKEGSESLRVVRNTKRIKLDQVNHEEKVVADPKGKVTRRVLRKR